MTTVVKGNKMMSDGLSTLGDFADQFNVKKIHKVGNHLLGFCGAFSFGRLFVDQFTEAYNKGGDVLAHLKESLPLTDQYSCVMILTPDKQLILYDTDTKYFYEYGNAAEGYAIGSGAIYAISALDAGADIEEALRVAIKRDVYSGGETFCEVLDEVEPELTHEDIDQMTPEELRLKLKQLNGLEQSK